MARRQTQRKSKTAKPRYWVDDETMTGNLPPNLGRGANIRLITKDGAVVQHNPNTFAKLKGKQRYDLVGAICTDLGIPTKENGIPKGEISVVASRENAGRTKFAGEPNTL